MSIMHNSWKVFPGVLNILLKKFAFFYQSITHQVKRN